MGDDETATTACQKAGIGSDELLRVMEMLDLAQQGDISAAAALYKELEVKNSDLPKSILLEFCDLARRNEQGDLVTEFCD